MSARARQIRLGAMACVLGGLARTASAAGTPCPALTAVTIPDVSIASATAVPAGPLTLPSGATFTAPAFCRVAAVATPRSDSRIEKTAEFFRPFLAPGMRHCSGGSGPNTLDALGALQTWVDTGTAPDRIVATGRAPGGAVERTRPLCLYPKVARWSGRGSTDDAANFACVDSPP
jgi:hypothetical protein